MLRLGKRRHCCRCWSQAVLCPDEAASKHVTSLKQRHARYSFVLSDTELAALRRLDRKQKFGALRIHTVDYSGFSFSATADCSTWFILNSSYLTR